MSRKTSRIVIDHPDEPGVQLVGTLEQLEPSASTKGRPIALICHGVMGHKDYLWQKKLAQALPLDSFRFDFRSNHESGGSWNFAGFPNEVQDLQAVVEYLTDRMTFDYQIALIIGHSRGSLVTFRWLCTSPSAYKVDAFVNISARFRMMKIYDKAGFRPTDRVPGEEYYLWRANVARKPREERVYDRDIETFANWDSALVRTAFPQHIDVLSIHGQTDDLVEPIDAQLYQDALEKRKPGTTSLYLVEGANHTFDNDRMEIVRAVLGWWKLRQSGGLTNTIWTHTPGPQPKARL
ncbi:alpha/beta-hydrolase [Exidia glandulosa HHB12029]|uniref:Alpha/beta-hydrolase n=1 Tax=Exidia glandulosa HHB12029 TaxID=1314781 RepID=A0A166NAF6_EXIGL|nr:alpha/beta-hydrolase [Exidia glandulosa HHB12029]